MNKNLSYIVAIVLAIGIVLTLMLDNDVEITPMNNINIEKRKEKNIDIEKTTTKSYEDIEIIYTNTDKKKKVTSKKKKEKGKRVSSNTKAPKEEKTRIYELTSTGSSVDEFEINIASSNPIPARNPLSFPQIPASIQGKIDGKSFSLVVPSDLGVKDFRVKIQNQKTGEVRFIKLEEEHLKPGSSSTLTIDSNNFENVELRSGNTHIPPLPPLPTIPKR